MDFSFTVCEALGALAGCLSGHTLGVAVGRLVGRRLAPAQASEELLGLATLARTPEEEEILLEGCEALLDPNCRPTPAPLPRSRAHYMVSTCREARV